MPRALPFSAAEPWLIHFTFLSVKHKFTITYSRKELHEELIFSSLWILMQIICNINIFYEVLLFWYAHYAITWTFLNYRILEHKYCHSSKLCASEKSARGFIQFEIEALAKETNSLDSTRVTRDRKTLIFLLKFYMQHI